MGLTLHLSECLNPRLWNVTNLAICDSPQKKGLFQASTSNFRYLLTWDLTLTSWNVPFPILTLMFYRFRNLILKLRLVGSTTCFLCYRWRFSVRRYFRRRWPQRSGVKCTWFWRQRLLKYLCPVKCHQCLATIWNCHCSSFIGECSGCEVDSI